MRPGLKALFETRSRFGTTAALAALADRILKRFGEIQMIDLIWLEPDRLNHSLEADPKFEFRFLTAEEVAEFSVDAGNDLDVEIFQRIEAGRDFCFAALCDGRLASYGWYAIECIESEHNFGIAMSYPQNVAYMYKGFTHPDFRGARLHGVGMGLALQSLKQHGVTALVSTIDWVNFPSMKSSLRLGYERLGRAVTVGASSRLVAQPKTALKRGICLGEQAAKRPEPVNRFTLDSTAKAAVPAELAAAKRE